VYLNQKRSFLISCRIVNNSIEETNVDDYKMRSVNSVIEDINYDLVTSPETKRLISSVLGFLEQNKL